MNLLHNKSHRQAQRNWWIHPTVFLGCLFCKSERLSLHARFPAIDGEQGDRSTQMLEVPASIRSNFTYTFLYSQILQTFGGLWRSPYDAIIGRSIDRLPV